MAKIDSGLGWKVDEEFYIDEADTLIDEDDYGRKKYDGAAIIAVVFEGENTQGRPVMISTAENNCLNTQAMTAYSSTVGGVTWYGTRQNTLLRENEIIVGAKVTVAEGINPYYFPDDADVRAVIISAIITQAGVEYTPKVTTTDYVKGYVEGVVKENNELILDAVNDILTDDTPYPSSTMVSIPDCKVPSNADVSVVFEPVQEGTGDPSPENIRPITGYNNITITRTGKNLLNDEFVPGRINPDGTIIQSNDRMVSKYFSAIQADTDYVLSQNGTGSLTNIAQYDAAYNFVKMEAYGLGAFKSAENAKYVKIYHNNDVISNGKWQLEAGSTPTTYTPYSATDYTINLGGTRYSGRVDISDTGEAVLIANKGYIASYNGETIGEPWISDRDVYSAGTTPTTGAEVVYTLDTPLTYQLANCPIQLLKGINNLYSDAGNISATADGITSAIGALTEQVNDITLYPAPPTTDGTYTLQVTVASGVPAYSWAAVNRNAPAVNESDEELKKSEDSGDISEKNENSEEKEIDISEKDVSEPAEKKEDIPDESEKELEEDIPAEEEKSELTDEPVESAEKTGEDITEENGDAEVEKILESE